MKKNINSLLLALLMLVTINSCSEKDYAMGDLTAPTDLVITTEVVGQSAAKPNGDGSGDVKITVSAKNALSYKVDFDANDGVNLVHLPNGTVTRKYATEGLHSYRITAVAYGKGGTSSSITKEVKVQFDYVPDPVIVTNLTGGTSKTWKVDRNTAGHFGVGPWQNSATPEWWSAAPNEKANDACFYSARFKFTKGAGNTYTLQVASPDGAFTKTGNLTTLPGIPASGGETCYAYGGGTSAFSFLPATTGIAASTKTAIQLAGNTTYIGYGAVQKVYEIISLTPTNMYLRVQGTETGNAWYLRMIPE